MDGDKESEISKEIPAIFLKPYAPSEYEPEVYTMWQHSGYFNPDTLSKEQEGEQAERGNKKQSKHSEPFCIIMPPPNANGALHVGHALFVTLQDSMVRYARMLGKRVLWVPGADHAGFETQVVYEKKLQKERRSRFDLSKEELYEEILAFTLAQKEGMENQLRVLGASCDWSRKFFTLDEDIQTQVKDTFQQMFEDKLLYRGLRSVHWCSKHQTGFSELELEHVERKDPFYYLQYGPFVIGTVRPETKFGDKYVVMHPDDTRYALYKHGDTLEVEWIEGTITATVIKDKAVDPEVGSGVMTITPWHSAVDWDIAQRHSLSFEQIIDERGKLLPIAGEFEGMKIGEAREKIVEKMDKKGLVVRVDKEYTHTVPQCYKCGIDIEPQLKEQWFVRTAPLAKKAQKAIMKGEVTFVTERYKRVALHWLEKLEDWNISRQIVWGIRIPAKICGSCKKGEVDLENNIAVCTACGGEMVEDTDTFDTWFSSGQLPFLVLGYPNGKDFNTYYPTQVMESGHDILFFWILRMLMLGLYRTGKVPFQHIYLHGLVLDQKGQKMSKSKGNVVNPIEVAKEFGTDALRMAYIVGNVPGQSINFSLDKIRAYKKFANKLWNISRFILSEIEIANIQTAKTLLELSTKDQELLKHVDSLAEEVTQDMNAYRFHLAAEKIYHYVWHTFADVIIEDAKDILQGTDVSARESKMYTLLCIHTTMLKLLHPFMPFITEKIWEHIPICAFKEKGRLLIVEQWPIAEKQQKGKGSSTSFFRHIAQFLRF